MSERVHKVEHVGSASFFRWKGERGKRVKHWPWQHWSGLLTAGRNLQGKLLVPLEHTF